MSACATVAVSTAIACADLFAAASAGLCSTRHGTTSNATTASAQIQLRLPPVRWGIFERSFIVVLPLMPAAAERGEQVHQRLQAEKIILYQLILSAEQRIFSIQNRQNVHGSRGHLSFSEFKRTLRRGNRFLLPLLQLGGLLRCDERVFDVAERSEYRLVVGRQQLGVARLAERHLGPQRTAVENRLSQTRSDRVNLIRRAHEPRQRRALVAAPRGELDVGKQGRPRDRDVRIDR